MPLFLNGHFINTLEKEITMQESTGFFYDPNEPGYIYEIRQNTDTGWLQEEPNVKYLVDTWELIDIYEKQSIYRTHWTLIPLQDFDTSNLERLNPKSHKLLDKIGYKLIIMSE